MDTDTSRSTQSQSAGLLAWSDQYLLGHAPLDDTHEEFVDIIGRMQRADDAALPALLDELHRHLGEHFGQEDRWMEESEFPPRACHIDEHAAVMASVNGVRQLVAQGDFGECRRLVQALADWFPAHADHLDSALAHWLAKRAFGGKPVVLRRGLQLR
jgi:hemerythrin